MASDDAEEFESAYGSVWAALHRSGGPADDLGQLERQILHHVAEPTSPGAIADHLGLPRSTTTVVLQRLASRGLVDRSRSPADERRVIVTRTPDGDRLVASDGFLDRALLAEVLAAMSPSARKALIDGLRRVAGEAERRRPEVP